MPSNSTRNTLARHWELLRLLPTRGAGKNAKQLTDELTQAGFPVSKRQVERDLVELRAIFALDCNDASIPYGWRWPATGSADLPGLTVSEALSLKIVEDTLKPLVPGSIFRALRARFEQAHAKLLALNATNRTARWASKVRTVAPALPSIPPRIDEDILETLQEALLSNLQVKATYHGMNDSFTELTLHPLGLINRCPVTYLVATAFDYQDVRLYALHRFKEATICYETVKIPEGFSLDQYVQGGALQFGSPSPIDLVLRIAPEMVRYLTEAPLSKNQKILACDDGHTLTANVKDTWQLRWWLLSQGASVEVFAPIDLRQTIAKTLSQAAGLYV